MIFFVAAFSVLDNFKALISSYFFFTFLFLNSFVCDGLFDGEIPPLQKQLDGLDDRSVWFIFVLLGL